MVYNEQLAARIRKVLRDHKVTEKKMFGGLAFMLYGNMCCGVIGDRALIRTGPEFYNTALKTPHVKPMDFTGRILRNFVYMASDGIHSDEALQERINHAITFVLSLPRKAS